MENNRQLLANLTDDQVQEIISKYNLDKPKLPERWRPEEGEMYYFIAGSDFSVQATAWRNDETDKNLFNACNVFSSKAEAQAEADYTLMNRDVRWLRGLELVDEPVWLVFDGSKFLLWYDTTYRPYIAFKSTFAAQTALDKYGDKLRQLLWV